MSYRDYCADTDLKAVQRIWLECGWIDDIAEDGDAVRDFFAGSAHPLVATIDDVAECAVIGANGTMRYLQETLCLGAVAGVTTSRIARKQGFARDLTARLLARQADTGHHISALGMFEQGFYDRLGFGSGNYEHWIKFDPATLLVEADFRSPKRLTEKNYAATYQAMQNRYRSHGGVTIDSELMFKAEMNFTDDSFGLGYYDGTNGTLSHFIWGSTKGEHGPYKITFCAYQTDQQLLELLALIKSLGDQINVIEMLEIGAIQLQDLLKQPLRNRRNTEKSRFVNENQAIAYWQARILDLSACLAKTKLNTQPLKFNLKLFDPVTEYLPRDSHWRGISGNYIIELGGNSSAIPGQQTTLPTLETSVNAFTRLWLGVRPASSLAVTTDLKGDSYLLDQLDHTFNLPSPHLGWDF